MNNSYRLSAVRFPALLSLGMLIRDTAKVLRDCIDDAGFSDEEGRRKLILVTQMFTTALANCDTVLKLHAMPSTIKVREFFEGTAGALTDVNILFLSLVQLYGAIAEDAAFGDLLASGNKVVEILNGVVTNTPAKEAVEEICGLLQRFEVKMVPRLSAY